MNHLILARTNSTRPASALRLLLSHQDLSKSTNRGWKGVQMGKGMKGPHIDIDTRLRCLQRELDRVAHSSNPTMTSSILHAAPQRYPTSTLRLNLEDEIDRLLREQVSVRKHLYFYLVYGDALRAAVTHSCIAPYSSFWRCLALDRCSRERERTFTL